MGAARLAEAQGRCRRARSRRALPRQSGTIGVFAREGAEKNPNLIGKPGWEGWGWGNFLANGQILYSSAVRASPGTYERAVVILNALAREAERRGIALAVNDKEGRIKLEDGHYPSYRQGRGPRVRI